MSLYASPTRPVSRCLNGTIGHQQDASLHPVGRRAASSGSDTLLYFPARYRRATVRFRSGGLTLSAANFYRSSGVRSCTKTTSHKSDNFKFGLLGRKAGFEETECADLMAHRRPFFLDEGHNQVQEHLLGNGASERGWRKPTIFGYCVWCLALVR